MKTRTDAAMEGLTKEGWEKGRGKAREGANVSHGLGTALYAGCSGTDLQSRHSEERG